MTEVLLTRAAASVLEGTEKGASHEGLSDLHE